ncbi:MAG: hypothetical protein WAL71_15265 [Terriglobales bacterium]
MKFYYEGDEPGGQMLSWFKLQLRAIGTLWDAELPEAALTIIYSGIDSFGVLAAPPGVFDAGRDTFTQWCEKYILTRLQSVDGAPITSTDLWAARCGVLHTSTPLSRLERDGRARQVFYQFKEKTGVNMFLNAKQAPLRIDIGNLGLAFKEGGIAFLTDLKNNPPSQMLAEDRAKHFLRWVTVVP